MHSSAEAGDVTKVNLVLGIQNKIDKLMQENSEINKEMTRLAERRQINDNRIKEQFLQLQNLQHNNSVIPCPAFTFFNPAARLSRDFPLSLMNYTIKIFRFIVVMSGLNRIALFLPGSDQDSADIPHDDKGSCAKRKPEVPISFYDCGNSNPWDKRRKTEKSITLIENETSVDCDIPAGVSRSKSNINFINNKVSGVKTINDAEELIKELTPGGSQKTKILVEEMDKEDKCSVARKIINPSDSFDIDEETEYVATPDIKIDQEDVTVKEGAEETEERVLLEPSNSFRQNIQQDLTGFNFRLKS